MPCNLIILEMYISSRLFTSLFSNATFDRIIFFIGTTTLAWLMEIGAWVTVAKTMQNMSKPKNV